ncbi:MAG: cytochrome biosis protein [Xanthobacteraceae bacterium]|nr:cytochrome biosis protein [Xanthobacteraceae bacterium]
MNGTPSHTPSSPGLTRESRVLGVLGWMRAAGIALALLIAGLSIATPVLAVQPDEVLSDPALEARARVLSQELRCMVCQNQSIDDSDAPLARDLRILVRERLKAGDSNDQVLDFLVARYGEFVLMRPTLHGANVLLWVAPFAVLGVGFAGAFLVARRRRREGTTGSGLSPDEEEKLHKLLDGQPADLTKL